MMKFLPASFPKNSKSKLYHIEKSKTRGQTSEDLDHISRSSGLGKTILQGTVNEKKRSIQKKRWLDNFK